MAQVTANGIDELKALIGQEVGPSDWREVTQDLIASSGFALGVNYGWNKVRFPAPVPSGSRIRARGQVQSVDDVGGGWYQIVYKWTVEVEGSEKPCCVAESVVRLLA